MRFNSFSINEAQRRGYNALTANAISEHERKPIKGIEGHFDLHKNVVPNKMYVPPKLTSSPAMLIQELPWINTTQQFNFNFAINGPGVVAGTNNIAIGKNDVFAVYGIQFLFGTCPGGSFTANGAAGCIYRSHGVIPNDDSFYNSFIQLKIESSIYIDKMEGQFFRDTPFNSNEYYGEIGLQLINPVRIVSGELGVFQLMVNLKNPIAGLVISAAGTTVVSCRLHGVYGQAQG